jgi:hypothetical protein
LSPRRLRDSKAETTARQLGFQCVKGLLRRDFDIQFSQCFVGRDQSFAWIPDRSIRE